MTYHIDWGYCGERHVTVDTLDQAIIIALTAPHADPAGCRWSMPRILGDGFDCDGDSEGFWMCSDGLTEEERERIENAGL